MTKEKLTNILLAVLIVSAILCFASPFINAAVTHTFCFDKIYGDKGFGQCKALSLNPNNSGDDHN